MKNLATISLPVFIICLFIAELWVRRHYPELSLLELTGKKTTLNKMAYWTNQDAFCAYEPKPGVYHGHKTVNKHGFISTPEIEVNKPSNVTRIVYLGESSTAGTGVNLSDDQTFPWIVDSLLKSNGYKVDFINAAAGGYTSFESYGRLWARIRFFNPDVVIVNHGWNDSYYFNTSSGSITTWRDGENGNFDMDFKVYYESYKPLYIDNFIYWSRILSGIRLYLYSTPGKGEIVSKEEKELVQLDNYDHKRTKIYSDNLQLIKHCSLLINCRLFVCKQPTLPTAKQPLLQSHFSGHGFSSQTTINALSSEYFIIDTSFKSKDVIDLTSLSGQKDLFHDNIHPTKKGSQLIAQIIFDSLSSQYFGLNQK